MATSPKCIVVFSRSNTTLPTYYVFCSSNLEFSDVQWFFPRAPSKQVSRDALKEERTPLLDLDDVEQFESELAACFDAPPPPPLNIRVSVFVCRVWPPSLLPHALEISRDRSRSLVWLGCHLSLPT